jgi:hypothetical protein
MSNDGWIGVAFRKGNHADTKDMVVMTTTAGEFVHCEVVMGKGDKYRAFGAYEGVGGFMNSINDIRPSQWTLIKTPCEYTPALGIAMDILSADTKYNYMDLWQCAVSVFLPIERDLDCEDPSSWHGGVFCSQAALLFTRRLAINRLIKVSPECLVNIVHANSRGCSPNMLFQILSRDFQKVF